MKLHKRIFSLLLALLLVVGMLPGAAIAASAAETDEAQRIVNFELYYPEDVTSSAGTEVCGAEISHSAIAAKAATYSSILAAEGYELKGWSFEKGTEYTELSEEGTTALDGEGDVTIYFILEACEPTDPIDPPEQPDGPSTEVNPDIRTVNFQLYYFDGSSSSAGTMTLAPDEEISHKAIADKAAIFESILEDAGYYISGWNFVTDGEAFPLENEGSTAAPEGEITIYLMVKTTPIVPDTYDYTLTYNANDGTEAPATKADSENLTGSELETVEFKADANTFTRAGYTFKGWAETATGAVKYAADDTVTLTKDKPAVTLYAVWEETEKPTYNYIVTYNANDGTAKPKELFDSENLTASELEKVTFKADANTFTRTGYTFQGWAETATGAVKYTADSPINLTKDNASLTLYAVWKENTVPTYDYEIIYHANYKDADPATKADGENQTGTTELESVFEADKNTFLRSGYTFQGWALSEEGNVKYKPGDSIKLKSTDPTLDLYAVWEGKSYTLTFDPNGGECNTKNKVVTIGAEVGKLPTPTKKDFNFDGWFNPDGKKVTEKTIYTLADNMTVKAKWTATNGNPKTGDNSHVVLYSWLMGLSFTALMGLGAYVLFTKKNTGKYSK